MYFLRTTQRDVKATERFLTQAIRRHGAPEKTTIDKSKTNTAAIEHYNAAHEASIAIRQNKYLNNLVEQDHRAIKHLTRSMLGFRSLWTAQHTLAGIEVMHMLKKGQMAGDGEQTPSASELFYSLAA